MGIDISQLSPAAQKQALAKLTELERRKAAAQVTQQPEQKPRKYRNQPTERITESGSVVKFDSLKEAKRYDELMLMLKSGQIRDLRLQQNFTLQEAYTTPDGERIKSIVYKADFCYERLAGYYTDVAPRNIEKWEKVVEDVKGGKATQTKVYAMKKKLMRDKYGITVQEV